MKTVKKIIAASFLAVAFAGNVQAQAVEEGTILIDATYGFPNFTSKLLREAYAGTVDDVTVKSLGPLAVKFEYLVSDKIGIGLEAGYANTTIEYSQIDAFNPANTYSYKVSMPRFRVMPKFNFHFADNDSFDAYVSVGAGYASSNITVETNQPDYQDLTTLNLFPVAARLAVGGRYFFSDAIGANLELGLGSGALVAAGLSIRIQ